MIGRNNFGFRSWNLTCPRLVKQRPARKKIWCWMVLILLLSNGVNVAAPLTRLVPPLAIVNCRGTNITTMSFQSPTLSSGTALQVGAVYRFPSVSTGVDALVQVLAFNNGASLNAIDGTGSGLAQNFQPELNNSSNADSSVDFQITFVTSGTSTAITIPAFHASGADIDGDGANIREYIELTGFSGYTLDNPTTITPIVTYGSPVTGRFAGSITTLPGITVTATSAIATGEYTNTSSFRYRIGALNAGSGTSTRLFSLYFDCISFIAPSTTSTPATAAGYKSVKLTTDADSSGSITAGDTLTWTIQYASTGAGNATSFQINDQLPSGVTISGTPAVTATASGTSASVNGSYTGAAAGAVSNLLAASATLAVGGVIKVDVPVTVNTGFTGTLSNQASATGTGLSAAVLSDNVDNATAGLPTGVTVPASSVAQTQNPSVDPTTATVSLPPPVSIAGKVWGDADNSANNTFTNINTGAETGTNAGGNLHAILVDASSNVIATTPVNSDGTYSFSSIAANQSNVTIRLATSAGTVSSAAPAAGLPAGWTNTSPLTTTAFNLGTSNLTGKDFGIEQLPTAAATDPASQTNPGGTTLVAVPSTHFTGSDPDGTIVTFKFTTFPTNATSVTINGTNYTAGTFPGGGVTVAAVSGALPASMVSVDPTDGAVTVDLPFTVIDNAGKESAAAATVHVAFSAAPPSITLDKTCPTPATCQTASQPPGTDLTYRIAFTNAGGSGAQQMVIVDAIPDNTDFKLSSATTNLGTTGLTVAVEYSNDYNSSSPGLATWTYTPTSGGGGAASGYDRNVKAMRWRVTAGTLSQAAPNNTGDVGFRVKIR